MLKTQLISAAAVLMLSIGCGQSDRAANMDNGGDPATRAHQALGDAQLGDVNLDWNKDTSVLRLQGHVATAADRDRAETIARDAVGTSGRVLNELSVDDADYYQPDNTQGSLRANLENIMRREFGADHFDINYDISDNGAVAIKGRVDSEATKTKVEELVRSTQGVTDVVNNLEVGSQG